MELKESGEISFTKFFVILSLLFLLPLFFIVLGSSTGFFVSETPSSITIVDFVLVCLVFGFLFVAYILVRK
ncbi:MAG: hypothetical protein QXS48_03625 [Candidatus Aenigmatarchaeota archaeon]